MLSVAALLAVGAACGRSPADARPSFLLVVFDTLRADAVSAYGVVEHTTPNLDALAAEGQRYEHAFAPSPWTLPSHATLFTGLAPARHGVGIGGRLNLPQGLATLAERLTKAGYETIGFSENPLVSAPFGLARGFSHFEGELDAIIMNAQGHPNEVYNVLLGVSTWARQRAAERPFFVFVNLFDPHDPYELRDDHRFLPPGVDDERARSVRTGAPSQGIAEVAGICDRLPSRADLAIVRGLYLGDVAAADAKLGTIHRTLVQAAGARPLVTIVTADHGEHLGENRLLGHEFSLHNEVLQVPLVVHGLPGAEPAVIEAPVELADIAPSILAWAGLDVRDEFPGEGLARAENTPERSLMAVFSDAALHPPRNVASEHGEEMDRRRRSCGPEDRVFGDMLSIVRFPWKLIWYDRGAPQLYDLSWDPRELSDVASHHPDIVARLTDELGGMRRHLTAAESTASLDERATDALRSLGYLE